MLVCNVSLLRRRAAIAAELAEAATALDAPGTGNVVFATLVDDPASVNETLDAFLGQIMLEAASAADAVSIAFSYDAAIVEAATAADAPDGTAGITTATWDPTTVTAVTLSGGNLVATNTGTTSADQGVRVATASGKTSGKHYFEGTMTSTYFAGNYGVGVGTPASTYTNMGNSATTGAFVFHASGNIWSNGSSSGSTLGATGAGTVIGAAVDLDNRKIWFKKVSGTPGNWNGSGTANPATNVGGITIPAGTMVPFLTFGGSSGSAGIIHTVNFGASAFTGSVPSGFTSGWAA